MVSLVSILLAVARLAYVRGELFILLLAVYLPTAIICAVAIIVGNVSHATAKRNHLRHRAGDGKKP